MYLNKLFTKVMGNEKKKGWQSNRQEAVIRQFLGGGPILWPEEVPQQTS